MNSWNEIRKAATAFSKRWKTAFDEKSQAQSFLKEFFAVFGVDAVTLANGRFREKTYDSNHRLVAETFGRAGGSGGVGGSPANTNVFACDIFGNRLYESNSVATIAGGSPSPATASYGYDDIGNSTNWPANCLNQYAHLSYDLDGNLLSDDGFSYAYDAANRLFSVSSNGTLLASFAYDAQGRRVRKLTPSATHAYFYDGWLLVRETLTTTDSQLTTDYFFGKDISGDLQGAGGVGGLLYLTVDGAIYIPCYDNNGNITRYLNSSGNTMAQYTYDAFGNIISQSGQRAEFFRHRFSTKFFDAESGLYSYGYRFYSPTLMRWLNRDPSGFSEVNPYLFCQNNSICRIDLDGRWFTAWTEETATQEIRKKIAEMRKKGRNFAADALEFYLGNHDENCDLSRYAPEIYNNTDWQKSFIDSVLSKLKEKDPKGTSKEVEIGDFKHQSNFDADLRTGGKIDKMFSELWRRVV